MSIIVYTCTHTMTPNEQKLAERFLTEAQNRAIGRLYHAVSDKIGHNELARRLNMDPGQLTRLKDRFKPGINP